MSREMKERPLVSVSESGPRAAAGCCENLDFMVLEGKGEGGRRSHPWHSYD